MGVGVGGGGGDGGVVKKIKCGKSFQQIILNGKPQAQRMS